MLQEISNFPLSVYSTEPHFSRSPKSYRHVTSTEIIDAMRDADFIPTRVFERKTRKADRSGFQRHVMRFTHQRDIENPVRENRPEIVIVNSHDGTSAIDVMAGLFRIVCSNGLIARSHDFGSIKFPHRGENLTSRVIDGVFRIVEDIPLIERRVEEYSRIELRPDQITDFAWRAASIRWGDESEIKIDPISLLQFRRGEDNGTDLWRVFNRVQENLTKGKIQGWTRDHERFRTIRAVRGAERDLEINSKLWALADEFAGGKILEAANA